MPVHKVAHTPLRNPRNRVILKESRGADPQTQKTKVTQTMKKHNYTSPELSTEVKQLLGELEGQFHNGYRAELDNTIWIDHEWLNEFVEEYNF